jgi:hypothetical protein
MPKKKCVTPAQKELLPRKYMRCNFTRYAGVLQKLIACIFETFLKKENGRIFSCQELLDSSNQRQHFRIIETRFSPIA